LSLVPVQSAVPWSGKLAFAFLSFSPSAFIVSPLLLRCCKQNILARVCETATDLAYYRHHGFDLDFHTEVVTGHIDFLQIRNGRVHILDYKPEARKEAHAHEQLTIYALPLARRTGLPLKLFECTWFDEKDYFEFYSLTGVYDVVRQEMSRFRKSPR
jgi:ATP-dependent exoDNAse (exonuclease V) beta subunit